MKSYPIPNMAQNAGFLTFAGLCFFIKGCMHLYRNSFGIANYYTFTLQVLFSAISFYYAARFFYSFHKGDRTIKLLGQSVYFPGSQVSHLFKFFNGICFPLDQVASVVVRMRWPFPTVYVARITLNGGVKIRLTNFTVIPSEFDQLLVMFGVNLPVK